METKRNQSKKVACSPRSVVWSRGAVNQLQLNPEAMEFIPQARNRSPSSLPLKKCIRNQRDLSTLLPEAEEFIPEMNNLASLSPNAQGNHRNLSPCAQEFVPGLRNLSKLSPENKECISMANSFTKPPYGHEKYIPEVKDLQIAFHARKLVSKITILASSSFHPKKFVQELRRLSMLLSGVNPRNLETIVTGSFKDVESNLIEMLTASFSEVECTVKEIVFAFFSEVECALQENFSASFHEVKCNIKIILNASLSEIRYNLRKNFTASSYEVTCIIQNFLSSFLPKVKENLFKIHHPAYLRVEYNLHKIHSEVECNPRKNLTEIFSQVEWEIQEILTASFSEVEHNLKGIITASFSKVECNLQEIFAALLPEEVNLHTLSPEANEFIPAHHPVPSETEDCILVDRQASSLSHEARDFVSEEITQHSFLPEAAPLPEVNLHTLSSEANEFIPAHHPVPSETEDCIPVDRHASSLSAEAREFVSEEITQHSVVSEANEFISKESVTPNINLQTSTLESIEDISEDSLSHEFDGFIEQMINFAIATPEDNEPIPGERNLHSQTAETPAFMLEESNQLKPSLSSDDMFYGGDIQNTNVALSTSALALKDMLSMYSAITGTASARSNHLLSSNVPSYNFLDSTTNNLRSPPGYNHVSSLLSSNLDSTTNNLCIPPGYNHLSSPLSSNLDSTTNNLCSPPGYNHLSSLLSSNFDSTTNNLCSPPGYNHLSSLLSPNLDSTTNNLCSPPGYNHLSSLLSSNLDSTTNSLCSQRGYNHFPSLLSSNVDSTTNNLCSPPGYNHFPSLLSSNVDSTTNNLCSPPGCRIPGCKNHPFVFSLNLDNAKSNFCKTPGCSIPRYRQNSPLQCDVKGVKTLPKEEVNRTQEYQGLNILSKIRFYEKYTFLDSPNQQSPPPSSMAFMNQQTDDYTAPNDKNSPERRNINNNECWFMNETNTTPRHRNVQEEGEEEGSRSSAKSNEQLKCRSFEH